MADTPKLDHALDRFDSAVSAIEAAMMRARDAGSKDHALAGEAQALREDRARLAGELDEVRANAERLRESNQAAGDKVTSAMARITSVLGEEE